MAWKGHLLMFVTVSTLAIPLVLGARRTLAFGNDPRLDCCRRGPTNACINACRAVDWKRMSTSFEDDIAYLAKTCGSMVDSYAKTHEMYNCLLQHDQRQQIGNVVGDLSVRFCCRLAQHASCRQLCMEATGLSPEKWSNFESCLKRRDSFAMARCVRGAPAAVTTSSVACPVGVLTKTLLPLGLRLLTPSLVAPDEKTRYEECVCLADGLSCSTASNAFDLRISPSCPLFEHFLTCSRGYCECAGGSSNDCKLEQVESPVLLASIELRESHAGVPSMLLTAGSLLAIVFAQPPLNAVLPAIRQFMPQACKLTQTMFDGASWIVTEGTECSYPLHAVATSMASGHLSYVLPGIVEVTLVHVLGNEPISTRTPPEVLALGQYQQLTDGLIWSLLAILGVLVACLILYLRMRSTKKGSQKESQLSSPTATYASPSLPGPESRLDGNRV